jgi:serine/threonine protein kinase
MSQSPDPLAATNIWEDGPLLEGKSAPPAADSRGPVAATPPPLPPLIGRYRIDGLLGGGGFGWVYRAFDEQLGRAVAIKVPDERLLSRMPDASAYRNEARLR